MPAETEGRWPLPEGWRWATVGEVAKVVGGGTPKASVEGNFAEPGSGVAWITPADLTGYDEVFIGSGRRDLSPEGLKGSSARVLPKGAVLFSSRAPVGYCAVAANPIATNQGFKSLVLKPGLDPEFVRLYLLASTEYAELAASGTTFKELSGARMKGLLVPVAPEREQERIVVRCNAIEAHRRAAADALGRLPDLLDRYRQSVLAAAFRGDLTAAWREAHPDAEPALALLDRVRAERRRRWVEDKAQKATDRAQARDAKKSHTWTEADRAVRLDKERTKAAKKYQPAPLANAASLGDLPDGWVWTTMDQVIETIQTGPFGSALHKSDYVEGGTPLVNPSNIVDGRIVPDSTKTVPDDILERLSGFKLKEADIVLGRRGEMGRCALVTETESGWLCGTGSLILRAETQVSASYLDALIRSPAVRFALEEASVGSTMSNLNQGVLKALAVALPPRDEQDEVVSQIAACSDRIGGVIHAIESGTAHIEKLRQATLARAFRGELVPTDADLAQRDGRPAPDASGQGRREAQTALDL